MRKRALGLHAAHLTVRAAQPLVAALEALGHPVPEILARAGIARSTLADSEGRVPHTAMMAFWQHAQALTGDANLGLHLAEAVPLHAFEVNAYALLASENLRTAYRRACRYQRLIHESTNLFFEEGGNVGVLRHTLPDGGAVPRQPAEFLVALWLRFGCAITGTDWSPALVCFAHEAPHDTSTHARQFRAPLRFASGITAMHVPNEVLDLPNPNADHNLAQLLDRYAAGLLRNSPTTSSFAERVRARLAVELNGGSPTVAEIACALHLSPRTLHRSLQNEGTTFRAVLEQLRKERATALLSQPHCSVAEAGFLLGFSEISSFSRAFKRWTGKAPATFRTETLFGEK